MEEFTAEQQLQLEEDAFVLQELQEADSEGLELDSAIVSKNSRIAEAEAHHRVRDEDDIVAEIEAIEKMEKDRQEQCQRQGDQEKTQRPGQAEREAEEKEGQRLPERKNEESEDPLKIMKRGREILEDDERDSFLKNAEPVTLMNASKALSLQDEAKTPLENGDMPANDSNGDGESVDSDEHPEAEQIRRQVEYYFSDENLENDVFLLGKMKGSKNKPIPIGIIHQFKKMRNYQPYTAVVEALRKCASIEVVKEKGKWCVQRKIPFHKNKDKLLGEELSKPPKTKPTGFEKYYADAPMTPDEAKEEEDLYDHDRPFADRMEIALQRYETKRRFTNEKRNIFNKWMKFGGIDTDQKQFTGRFDEKDAQDMTAIEIAAARSSFSVGDDKHDSSIWTVDFYGVAASFLSEVVPFYWFFDTAAECRDVTNILRNFYNYLLHHSVCPEYGEDIRRARELCDTADHEMHAVRRAEKLLPGAFNTACSAFFGGHYAALRSDAAAWSPDVASTSAMSGQGARQLIAFGLAAHGDTLLGVNDGSEFFHREIVRVEERIGLQVAAVYPADADVRALYATAAGKETIDGVPIRVLGRLICTIWRPDTFTPPDVPAHLTPTHAAGEYEFWVEEDALQWCFVGMKMEATVQVVQGGLTFLDEIGCIRCSFDTVLVNELLRGYKEPVWFSREEHLEREARLRGDVWAEGPADEAE